MKSLSHPLRSGASAALLALSISVLNSAFAVPKAGDLEVVAELPMRPGNVAPAPHNRLFATVHPLAAPDTAQLIEITDRTHYKAAVPPPTTAKSTARWASPSTVNSACGLPTWA